MDHVPVIDLLTDRNIQVQTLDSALREFGFFYVKNHGLDTLVDAQFQMAEKLFALPQHEKDSMSFDARLDIGYVGQNCQNLDPNLQDSENDNDNDNDNDKRQSNTDTKEQFMQTNNCLISTSGLDPVNAPTTIDPSNVFAGSKNYEPNIPDYTAVTGLYASQAYQLNQKLNDLLFDALKLDSTTRTNLGQQPFLVLKQMKYAGEPSDPSNGRFGAGAHCDWGSFTILATDQTPGLQIYHDDKWLPVPPKPDCLIINSGDQIAQLTNDTYKSALHRVVTTSTKPRFSTAVFTYFNVNSKVGPLPQFVDEAQGVYAKYPSRTTLEYFHFKLHQSFGITV